MRCFNWNGGKISEGLSLQADDRLGPVVFLGEAGRGRRYEKIALGRRNPAEVVDGRVLAAYPVKITLPARGGKPEKAFFVLERPRSQDDRVLVRVSTRWCYTKNSVGSWSTVAGSPENLVVAYGAHGDAGRIGNWDDGLVVMKPGDVLKVRPEGGHKTEPWAIWLEEGRPLTATWKDYENLQAVAKAEAMIAEAQAAPEALEVISATVPAYSWFGGGISEGIQVDQGATGAVVSLGEGGRGRKEVEIPLVGVETETRTDSYGRETSVVLQAALVKLDEKEVPARHSWDKPVIKTIFGLTQLPERGDGFLVRVRTSGPYTKGTSGEVAPWKGSPLVVDNGEGAHGQAGRVGGWEDALVLMREGDSLYVRQEGGYKSAGPWAVYVEGGQLRSEEWQGWKLRDAQSDPAFYVAKGMVPLAHTPADWVGRIASVCYLSQGQSGCGPEKTYLQERATGQLIRVESDSVVLNLGWDGREYFEEAVAGPWVRLEKGKEPRTLEGEELARRQVLRAKAEELRAKALTATEETFFAVARQGFREKVEALAQETRFNAMPTTGWRDSLEDWVTKAEAVLGEFEEAVEELQDRERRQKAGEILVDFGGYFRRMGVSGNGDHWVIQADGRQREPDEVEYRKGYTSEGIKGWRLVAEDELALSWTCGSTRDVSGTSEFRVAKAPVGEATPEQLEAVTALERELGVMGAWGLNEGLREVFEQRLEAIRRACEASPVLRGAPEHLDYLQVAGADGMPVYDTDVVGGRVTDFVDWNGPWEERCDNRDAQLVDSQSAGDGVVELLVFEKYGTTNLNLRWRPRREDEEESQTEAAPEAEANGDPLSKEELDTSMAALMAKFGKK